MCGTRRHKKHNSLKKIMRCSINDCIASSATSTPPALETERDDMLAGRASVFSNTEQSVLMTYNHQSQPDS